jgi:hypothetical protein
MNTSEIRQLWETPVYVDTLAFSDEFNEQLKALAIAAEREASDTGSFYDRTVYYNLFAKDDPVLKQFEDVMSARFRDFLYRGIKDGRAYEWDVEVRAFANIYGYGQRIRPHYHHGCDFVSVYYADVGDGSKPDFRTNEEGRFVVIDPRGACQYPVHAKSTRLPADKGTLMIHPAYLWHESETFFAGGQRVMISCEYTILHDQRKVFTRLAKAENPNPPPIPFKADSRQTLYTTHYK